MTFSFDAESLISDVLAVNSNLARTLSRTSSQPRSSPVWADPFQNMVPSHLLDRFGRQMESCKIAVFRGRSGLFQPVGMMDGTS
jgi:hypothetical protein